LFSINYMSNILSEDISDDDFLDVISQKYTKTFSDGEYEIVVKSRKE